MVKNSKALNRNTYFLGVGWIWVGYFFGFSLKAFSQKKSVCQVDCNHSLAWCILCRNRRPVAWECMPLWIFKVRGLNLEEVCQNTVNTATKVHHYRHPDSMLDFNQHLYTEPHLHFYPHCRCSLFQESSCHLSASPDSKQDKTQNSTRRSKLGTKRTLLAHYLRKKSWIKKHQRRGIGTWYFFRTPILIWKEETWDQKELVRKISKVFAYSLKKFGNDS